MMEPSEKIPRDISVTVMIPDKCEGCVYNFGGYCECERFAAAGCIPDYGAPLFEMSVREEK